MSLAGKNRITFYGPTSSGKTMLFKAFLRSMQMPDLRKKLGGSGLEIIIQERNIGGETRWKDLVIPDPIKYEPPTDQTTPALFRIVRSSPKKDDKTRAVNVSASCYYLTLIDDKGGLFEPGMNSNLNIEQILAGEIPPDPAPQTENETHGGERKEDSDKEINKDEQIQFAWEQLRQSNVIFILLDPLAVYDRNGNNNQSQYGFSLEQWARFVQRIAELQDYSEEGTKQKKIAICCGKVDAPSLFPDYNAFELLGMSNVDAFINRRFDTRHLNNVRAGIDLLKTKYGEENVKSFLISAAGWHNKYSNHDRHNKDNFVINAREWKPHDVIEPFRWVFSLLDKERIARIKSTIGPIWRSFGAVNSRDDDFIDYY